VKLQPHPVLRPPQNLHIYIKNVTTIPPLMQRLNLTAHQQCHHNPCQQSGTGTTNNLRFIPVNHSRLHTGNRAEFHTYKPKEEINYRVVLKNMHYSTNPDEMKTEIEKLGHKVANVWNITQYRTKLPLSMFFVHLKPAPTNKTIFEVECLNHCKIKFEPPRHKRKSANATGILKINSLKQKIVIPKNNKTL
jgi:hypothetical protein